MYVIPAKKLVNGNYVTYPYYLNWFNAPPNKREHLRFRFSYPASDHDHGGGFDMIFDSQEDAMNFVLAWS